MKEARERECEEQRGSLRAGRTSSVAGSDRSKTTKKERRGRNGRKPSVQSMSDNRHGASERADARSVAAGGSRS